MLRFIGFTVNWCSFFAGVQLTQPVLLPPSVHLEMEWEPIPRIGVLGES